MVLIKNPNDQKCKLKKACKQRLIDALLQGATYELACNYAGINYSTYRRWMIQGEIEDTGAFRDLYDAVKAAEGEAAMKWLKAIDASTTKDWQAAAWKLERRYWKSYSKHVETIGIGELADQFKAQGASKNDEVNNCEKK